MNLAEHALHYAARGFEIFPVKPDTKAPYTEHGMTEATTDTTQIEVWWKQHPDALIAARVPEDTIILDIDPRHGGSETWAELEREHGPIITQRWHLSGRDDGGRHIWLTRPDGKLSIRPLNEWARAHNVGHAAGERSWTGGIDLLHHRHRYTILPPSPHPATGKPYKWGAKHSPSPCPPWLAELVTRPPDPPPNTDFRSSTEQDSIADWYSNTHSWQDIIGQNGWELVAGGGDDDGSKWRHPAASAESSATIKHGCLFVYSPNTDFDVTEDGDPHGYTRFRAYAILEHDGDLTAAASAARTIRDPETWENWFNKQTKRTNDYTPDDDTPPDEDTGTSWQPINLVDAINGTDIPPPTILARVDGPCLLYPGRIHWFQGESESLKTWAALAAITQTLDNGGTAGFIDFEDDERGFVARLKALSVDVAQAVIENRLHYIRPEEPLHDRHGLPTRAGIDFKTLIALKLDLWIIDGVTVAMTTEGLEIYDNADVARWMNRIPKRLASTGATVTCLDHVVKNKEAQGRYAIGGQHKLAGLNGAAYSFEVLRPLSRAFHEPIEAAVRITVQKDRPGHVRAHATNGIIATMQVTAYPDGGVAIAFLSPETLTTPPMALVRAILDHLKDYDGSTQNKIEQAVDSKATTVRDVLKWMVAEPREWIRVEKKGQSHLHWLTPEGRSEL